MNILMNEKISEPPAAGIKVNPGADCRWPASEVYSGISFCDAVRSATEGDGKAVTLDSGSISVCRWSKVVLGFNEPDPALDLKVQHNLLFGTESILIAPISMFDAECPPDTVLIRTTPAKIKKIIKLAGESPISMFDAECPPDTVLIRTTPAKIKKIIKLAGESSLAGEHADDLGKSALAVLSKSGNSIEKTRVELVNGALARLNSLEQWRDFTKWIFKHQLTTYVFDLLLDKYLANMSMCRNSTVIPFLSGKLNVSYFCTGGIAWGMNSPEHLACGMPHDIYARIAPQIADSYYK